MPSTTPPEAAPLIWRLGGPWHGRRILRPGRTTAFELALIIDGAWMIQTYTYVGIGHLVATVGLPPIYSEGWLLQAQRDGWWAAADLRRGRAEREMRYLYRETANAR